MITRVHQLFGTAASAGGDSVATIMVPYKGTIVAAILSIVAITGQSVRIRGELSFQSANQLAQNDATSLIVSAASQTNIDAGGGEAWGIQGSAQSEVYGVAIPIDAVSKVYAHVQISAAVTWELRGTLYIATRG